MKLLVLGGTQWVGRRIAISARARGHKVTCLARGRSGQAPPGVTLLVRDRDEQYGLLPIDEDWDAVIDVSRTPEHVRRALHQLRPRWYGFVSSTSVYADLSQPGVTESAPLNPPQPADQNIELARYGSSKVACENAVREALGADGLIARVGLIGGPGDNSFRTRYWPWRFAHPSNPDGAVLVPFAPEQPVQLLDVRDLADWLVRCAENRLGGTFNVAGRTHSFSDHIAAARKVSTHTGPLVAASPSWLQSQGVRRWSGDRSLPIWLADPALAGLGAVDASGAYRTDLACRPLTDTLTDTLAAELPNETIESWTSGLRDEDERALLAAHANR